jgi:TolB-like protein
MAKDGDDEKASGSTPSVFISYASLDGAIAETACEALEKAGVTCWIAPRDVTPGAFYGDEIVHAIDAAKAIVLILSQNAATSPHVLREVERATSKRHAVISLRIDKAPLPAGLEYFLNTSQWLDASSGDTVRALPKLVSAVQAAIQAPTVTPIGVPTAHAPAPAASARSGKRLALVVASVVSLALVGFAADRLWLSSHRAPATPATTPAASAPVPVTAAPTIPEKSVAVLPFVDMSEKKDQEYFADGMAEEIIDLLAKVRDLHVPARTSSFYFKGKSTKVPDIARELRVADVLEGSIRRSGNQIRVTAQLVRADNGYHLWSQTYDRDLQDVFKVQDEIANSVVQALQISLMNGPLTRKEGGTQNLEAYQLYLRAFNAYEQNTKESLETAREHAERAIKLDPDFALAWTALGWTTISLAQLRALPITDGFERARQLALHALQVSPELTDGYHLLGYIHRTYDWDWAAAQEAARRALALDPTNPYSLLLASQISATLGHWDDAERHVRAALVRDPLSTDIQWHLATTLYRAGRFADAEAAYRKLIELAPDYAWARGYLAKTLLAEGKPEAALAMAQQERDEANRLDTLPIVLQAAGRHAEAEEALKALATKYAHSDAYCLAMNYAYRNDHDVALQWLERAYKQKDGGFMEIVGEPLFKNLANDPRYKAFLHRMNLRE